MNTDKGISRIAGRRGTGCSKFLRLANAFLIALLASTILPVRPASAQQTPPVYSFPECENVREKLLLGELNRITRSVFEEGQSALNIAEIVGRNWAELDMDSVVDAAVDEAADYVLESEGLWDRIKSGWHPPTAEEFTKKVVTNAFESTRFGDSIDQLSREIVDDLSVEVHVMTLISASSTLLCVQEFIGTSFSQTFAMVLDKNIEEWLAEMTVDPEVDTDVSAILKRRTYTLTGVSLVLGTQIARLLARKLAQQIVGKVVARIIGKAAGSLIPVAGWIIGGALIVWDLIQLQDGSVPQIRESLKGQDVKKEIRAQIAVVVENELGEALPALSDSVALDIYYQWKRFLKDFEHVLRLAEKNEHFRTIVDGVTADQVDKLSELVAVGTEALGTELLDRIIETGEFERILALPKITFEILRDTADSELVLAWADFAGDGIVSVVTTEVYKVTSPSDFGDRETLEKVLALEDSLAIQELMNFKVEERMALLSLPTEQTKWLLSELSEEDLAWLLGYFSELQGKATENLVGFVIRDRVVISELQGSGELRSQFPAVLHLAERNSKFQTILNGTAARQVDKLSELVAVASEALEPEEIAALIDSGQFEEILALPRATFAILREKEDPALVIEWAALAGEAVIQIVETGLFRVATPSDFSTKDSLSPVIALQNYEAITKLMLLDRAARDVLIELPTLQARAVLVALTVEELSWLSGYIRELTDREAGLIAESILREPGLLSKLKVSENFQTKFPEVLTLSERNQNFKDILNDTGVGEMEKLSNLVAVAVESLTPEQLASEVESGQIERIFALPEAAFVILKEKKDPALVLVWADFAGEEVNKVVETELFLVASPPDFSGFDALNKVLAVEDPAAIRKLMQLHQIERVVLLGLETVGARSALIALSMEDLSWLALFLAELPADEKDPVVEYILQEQGLIPLLKDNENVRTKFPRVLMLSLNLPRFEEFLTSLSVDELEKLSELVSAADATMTPEQLAIFLESDQLIRIFSFPQNSFDILRVTGNPALVLEWAGLAGEALVEVVETGLYLVAAPDAFHGRADLESVLAIENPVAIQRLMKLERSEREALLKLSPEEARATLLSDLSEDELSWLAGYLPDLPALTQQLLAYYVVREQKLIPRLRDSEEFQEKFPRVLNLALKIPPFKNILDNEIANDLGKLSELVVVAEEALDPDQLPAFIESGQFEHIFSLPQAAFVILKSSKDPALVIAWADLAGEAIIRVVSTELHKNASPDQFMNREELGKALDIQDPEALKWILQLNQGDRSFLLTSQAVANVLWLVSFKSDLSDDTTVLLAGFIDQNPALMSELEIESIGQSFKVSQNPEAVLTFVSARTGESETVWPTAAMFASVSELISGDLPNALYLHYYLTQWLILLTALLVLTALSISGWRLFRRRQFPEIWDRIRRTKGGRP